MARVIMNEAGGFIEVKSNSGKHICTVFDNKICSTNTKQFFYERKQAEEIAHFIKEKIEEKYQI